MDSLTSLMLAGIAVGSSWQKLLWCSGPHEIELPKAFRADTSQASATSVQRKLGNENKLLDGPYFNRSALDFIYLV